MMMATSLLEYFMARARIQLKQLRKLLSLTYEHKLSLRETAQLSGISKTTISEYLVRFRRSGISYDESLNLSDTELVELLEEKKQEESEQYTTLVSLFPEYSRRLKKRGMTKQLLWKEYKKRYPDGYAYSQFCHHFGIFLDSGDLTMRQAHEPGDMMFIDYSGAKLNYLHNGELKAAEVYVAILGASQLTYVEACESQKQEDFIRATEGALRYFGGVPRALVPDNLKAAVLKASKYEPELNPLFDDFAEYFRTTIIPARAYRPKDKALVENAVKLSYQRIFAPVQDRIFHSLAELNQAIRELLEEHNTRKLSKLQISRRELFNEIEKEELKTLPSSPYPLKYFETHKVAVDYHIILSEDKHYYSVPYQLKGKQVKVIFDDRIVAIYADNLRIAQHRRNKKRGQYTTLSAHMPPKHQFVHSWSAERFQTWARSIGEEAFLVVSHLLRSKPHEQQAYKSCLGVLSLAKKHGSEDLNLACRRALNYNRISFKEVELYLKDLIDRRNDSMGNEQILPFATHKNLRDKALYK
jgi:transposase